MLMSKNANNDVVRDSPVEELTVIILFTSVGNKCTKFSGCWVVRRLSVRLHSSFLEKTTQAKTNSSSYVWR